MANSVVPNSPRKIPSVSGRLIQAAQKLSSQVDRLTFSPPVTHVYNPLNYARAPHEAYISKFGDTRKRVVFLGMNPGPFGMVQTGVPFGEIAAVRAWLQIGGKVCKPAKEHPQRPILGFECPRSEVSGQRLWGLFAARFGNAGAFFADHFVLNYCPLAFLESTGRNRTPDKLTPGERSLLGSVCDQHLLSAITALDPEWVIGIGDFAMRRATEVLKSIRIGRILHPSPASPAANQGWASAATRQLQELGIWK